MPLILVTNDDGISSTGIKMLARALTSVGEVYVVAPETEQSAVSHALTLHRPLRPHEVDTNTFCVNGTPTDCVIIAVNKLLPRRPDIVISGINHGGNLGDDITYSGTVAAAMEGMILGIPSMAVSLVTDYTDNGDFHKSESRFVAAAEYAAVLSKKILAKGLPKDTLLNINVPDTEKINGVKITKQGKLAYDGAIRELSDPRGRTCYWIGGGIPQWEPGEKTDLDAVRNGYISITPVHLDLTNYEAMKYIEEKWEK
ncbi:MAG: stationary phase survival protein SurE [Nitrospira bacterium SG8_35_4]|nr:MAG: stationary phase survival protein SurE [Nitrospira bacterium SG8_35_4]